MKPLGVSGGCDDVIAGLHFQQEPSDLTDLLADHDVAGVFGVRFFVERIKLVSRRDVRKVGLVNPTDCGVPTLDKLLGVAAEVGSNTKNRWSYGRILNRVQRDSWGLLFE